MTETINSSMASEKELIISRIFNVPREMVFKAFAEAEHMTQWWVSRRDYYMQVKKMEFQPGGVFHYFLKIPDGDEMFGKFVYLEIESPEKIVFLNSSSDEAGNTIRGRYSPLTPLEIITTVILTEEYGNKTKLTLTLGAYNATEEEEQKHFEEMHSGMQKGFKDTFDELEEYLARV